MKIWSLTFSCVLILCTSAEEKNFKLLILVLNLIWLGVFLLDSLSAHLFLQCAVRLVPVWIHQLRKLMIIEHIFLYSSCNKRVSLRVAREKKSFVEETKKKLTPLTSLNVTLISSESTSGWFPIRIRNMEPLVVAENTRKNSVRYEKVKQRPTLKKSSHTIQSKE